MRDHCSAVPVRKSSTRRIRVPKAALPRDTARVDGASQQSPGESHMGKPRFDWIRYAEDRWELMLPCPTCRVKAEEECQGGVTHRERKIAVIRAAKVAMFTEEWG
jgi:hypothetical protein